MGVGFLLGEWYSDAPKIFAEAIKSWLGIFALAILVIAGLGYFLFKDSEARVKVFIYIVLFVGLAALGVSVERSQRSSAVMNEYENLPLHLDFGHAQDWNPFTVALEVYVDHSRVLVDEGKSDNPPTSNDADRSSAKVDSTKVDSAKMDSTKVDSAKVDRGYGGVVVVFRRVHAGQVLRVEAHDGGLTWVSDDYHVPESTTTMKRVTSNTRPMVELTTTK